MLTWLTRGTDLASIRDFPLFEGDFFPDHLKVMLAPLPPSRSGPPMLCRETSSALAASLKNKTKSMRKRFLVATLQQSASASAPAVSEGEVEISDELVDKRMDFLRLSADRHWQFNEIRRAHYSTMMVLAALGGSPK